MSLFLAAGAVFADDAVASSVAKSPKTAVERTAESELERDNDLLKKENHALRRQVVALRKSLGEDVAGKKADTAKNDSKTAVAAESGKVAVELAKETGLEVENERIRSENQALRRQVVALRTRVGNAVAEGAAAVAKRPDAETDAEIDGVDPDKELDERWLSGSKKRHNSSCRYFKVGHGCLCTPADGTPCKVCGG